MKGTNVYRTDHEIVALYWARSETAIYETDRKYRRLLLSVITNILTDTRDGEECISDTYLGVWNAIPPARPQVLPAFLTRSIRRSKSSMSERISSVLMMSTSRAGSTLSST